MLVSGIEISVIRKNIKNVHLAVHPPAGEVRISAPYAANEEVLRLFVIDKLSWIREQQRKFQAQERPVHKSFETGESHQLFGRRLLLVNRSGEYYPRLTPLHKHLLLREGLGLLPTQKESVISRFQRKELRAIAVASATHWSEMVGIDLPEVGIKQMRTKWGSCSRTKTKIWLNLELAQHPQENIEYVVLHEVVHLLHPNHGPHFVALLDRHMPNWRMIRQRLNDFIVSY